MAYGGNEEVRVSEYNELAFKMKRIHMIQTKLHQLWENPLGYWHNVNTTPDQGEIGVRLILNNLENLYYEVSSKCTDEEKEEYNDLLETIEEKIGEDGGVFEIIPNLDKRESVLDRNKWNELRKELRFLQNFIGELLQNHGYNPDRGMDEGL